ncbi:MAG: hypothetical protein QN141_05520 [Armatimonadota bacterium]|nr:hypothetical protein [Armatimonadota bacterium]MDR7452378.1 hypothetical protein [Armatimonadota bacterium]MDR7466723.1 hypothetical protein [Armatimonadota bacterium]MDR7492803.1 hypothetical protein [Armatimonadota bacterium]MDR7498579.1 hypothetical protein [Armatimonadota bacterium]
MGALAALLFTVGTSAAMAYAAHLVHLAHFHVLGGIPVGAVVIGAGAAVGASVAVRLYATYDTATMRIIAQMGGLFAYAGAVGLDFFARHPTVLQRPLLSQTMEGIRYLQLLIREGGAAFALQMPAPVRIPAGIHFWIGGMRLLIEIVGAAVATGWMLSLLTDVPFCWKNRRFYELRSLVESADAQAVREWEMAMHQRRPVEARAIMTRVRAAKVGRGDRRWMRIVVHQCPVCRASRVRIERRRRGPGYTRTDQSEEIVLDAARGAVLLAT